MPKYKPIDEVAIIKYYETHCSKDTEEHFNISRTKLNSVLNKNNIVRHTQKENMCMYNAVHGNPFANSRNNSLTQLIESINKEEFEQFYTTHAIPQTLEKYNIQSEYILNKVLVNFDIPKLSPTQKRELTILNKYKSHDSYSKQMVGNLKKTKLEKYGDENFNNLEKAKQTCLEKYGVENPFQAEEIKSKINYSNNNREKARQTTIDKYGVESHNQLESVKEKKKQTLLRHYGTTNAMQVTEIRDKQRQTTLRHYGVDHNFKSPEIQAQIQQTVMDRYGVLYACQTPQCKNANPSNDSLPNRLFANQLDSNNIYYTKEHILDKFRYDFKVGTSLIEINPTVTHNTQWNPWGEPIDMNYHRNKSRVAIDNNYRCIHIWDWDDKDKIVQQLLLSKLKIYARKCVVKEVSKSEAKEFISENHLQGYAKDEIRLGLYYNDSLVSIMTFGKPRYNKNYEYELIRYCSNYNIIGGAEKLFKNFIRLYNPKSIISYCDLSKFDGHTYIKLGFTLKNKPTPSKHWYNITTKKHITDNLLRQRGFDQLFGTNYGKGTSNEYLMLLHDFLPIYDCGQATYIWNSDD